MSSTSSDAMEPVVLALCEAVDSPRALSTWLCFKYNQEALLELPPVDFADNDTQKVSLDYFLTEYLSKYKGLKVKWDPKRVALDKWKLTEQQCLDTNRRFRNETLEPTTGSVSSVLFRTQRKIESVLGRLHYPIVLADCKWGPGATFDMKREDATLDKKISQKVSVTAQSLPLVRAIIETDPHWAACFVGVVPDAAFCLLPSCFKIVRGSRFLTVPKSAKTDRCIAAEPSGNGFLQQGVHSYMRRRLKRFGVDLDDQSWNQELARRAYLEDLATLDLSAASDTISREVVFHLLPLDWAIFLDLLRSPETLVDGVWTRTEKFASMGNAFCFELETLIFWAIASSVLESLGIESSELAVYGDDIIVPRRAAGRLMETLGFCGFTINMRKSFVSGNFFESCGKHYHRGREITPAFQKETLKHPSELIRAHNRLIRLQARMNALETKPFRRACSALTKLWTLKPFPKIPQGVSEDGGFIRPKEEFLLDRNHGYKCRVFDYVSGLSPAREDALYAYKLRRKQYLNPDRQGYGGCSTKGVWRSKARQVHESAMNSSWVDYSPERLK